MVRVFVDLIEKGLWSISQVPEIWKADVTAQLEARGIESVDEAEAGKNRDDFYSEQVALHNIYKALNSFWVLLFYLKGACKWIGNK